MKYDLEERLIDYAVSVLDISELMPNTRGANHLTGQLVRSGTAPALMYGEAQSAESRRDFIHKVRVLLKELRETFICLKVIRKKGYLRPDQLEISIRESSELIAIFVKSIETAEKNMRKSRD